MGVLLGGAVVHSSVPSVCLFLLLPPVRTGGRVVPLGGFVSPGGIVSLVAVRACVVAVAHAGASMATLSAAIPREPYALTEPRDMPSVSATWASVMSAK